MRVNKLATGAQEWPLWRRFTSIQAGRLRLSAAARQAAMDGALRRDPVAEANGNDSPTSFLMCVPRRSGVQDAW